MRMRSAMVWVSLAMSCGDAPDAEVSSQYTSGTRLHAKLTDGGDGAVMFSGWRDTELDLDCAFRLMADGVWRCVPVSQVTAGFADAACTQPIVVDFTDAACAPPASALEAIPATGCEPTRFRLLGVGARLGDGPLFLQTARGCEDYSVLAPYQRFAAGAPLEVTGFIAATSVIEARGDGLAVTALTALDGAHELAEMVDPRRGPCQIYDREPSGFTCVANLGFEGGPQGFFVDAACAVDAPAVYPTCADWQPGAVATADGFHMPGARIDDPVYETHSDACAVDEDRTAYEIGPRMVDDDLPAITEATVGVGRLRARAYADGHGRPLQSAGFYDTVEQANCSVVAVDGVWRCLSWRVTFWSEPTTLFADAACTVRVISLERGSIERVASIAPSCGGLREVEALHRVAHHEGVVYESLAPGTCTSVARDPAARYFADAEQLSLDTFPVITMRIE